MAHGVRKIFYLKFINLNLPSQHVFLVCMCNALYTSSENEIDMGVNDFSDHVYSYMINIDGSSQ